LITHVRKLLAAAVPAVAALALAAPALAGTDTYCLGCTIGAQTSIEDTHAFFLTLDYVHRLSGPTCSTIGAYAHYTDGTYGSEVTTDCATEVEHGYNGSKNGWGGADNQGAGNYGFNAHVDY
jgi:hypothetical protein